MADLDELAEEFELLDTAEHNLRPTAERQRLCAERRCAREEATIRCSTVATQRHPTYRTIKSLFFLLTCLVLTLFLWVLGILVSGKVISVWWQ